MMDRVFSRVLGALRPVAAPSNTPITRSLQVSAPNVQMFRNRRGLYILQHVEGLKTQEDAELVVPAANPVAIVVTVRDALGVYLPRQMTVNLPRNASPVAPLPDDSLFRPIDVVLYPSPLVEAEPGWAVVRASVRRAETKKPVPGAFLRVRRPGAVGQVLARGLADARGEALLAVAGIPVVSWDADPHAPVITTDIETVVEAFDGSTAQGNADPDSVERQLANLPRATASVRLAPGRNVTTTLEVTLQ